MDTPFSFEGKYHQGKNSPEDEDESRELVDSIDTVVLLESVDDKLNNPELYGVEGELVTEYRYDLRNILEERLKGIEKVDELESHYQYALQEWVRTILSSGDNTSFFHTENELDRAEGVESSLAGDPYDSFEPLLDSLQQRFRQTFWTEIDVLNVIPRDTFLTFNGEIQSVDFELVVDKEKMSAKFKDKFSDSRFFYITYDRYEESRPYHKFYVNGMDDNGEFEEVVELDGLGGAL